MCAPLAPRNGTDDYCVPLYLATTSLSKLNARNPTSCPTSCPTSSSCPTFGPTSSSFSSLPPLIRLLLLLSHLCCRRPGVKREDAVANSLQSRVAATSAALGRLSRRLAEGAAALQVRAGAEAAGARGWVGVGVEFSPN